MPNKIKTCLEKSKIMDEDWKDDKKLYSLINECFNIENNVTNINNFFATISKAKNVNIIDSIYFVPEEDELNSF